MGKRPGVKAKFAYIDKTIRELAVRMTGGYPVTAGK